MRRAEVEEDPSPVRGSTGTVVAVVVQDVKGFGGGDSDEELEGEDREHFCEWIYLSIYMNLCKHLYMCIHVIYANIFFIYICVCV